MCSLACCVIQICSRQIKLKTKCDWFVCYISIWLACSEVEYILVHNISIKPNEFQDNEFVESTFNLKFTSYPKNSKLEHIRHFSGQRASAFNSTLFYKSNLISLSSLTFTRSVFSVQNVSFLGKHSSVIVSKITPIRVERFKYQRWIL